MAILAAFSTLLLLAASPAEDQPAAPKYRPAIAYPTGCVTPGEQMRKEQVTLAYTVDKGGRTRSIRVRETTNACFNDAAVAAARGWTFEPRRVSGKAVAQEDLETTIYFVLNDGGEETAVNLDDFDARPIKRIPPRYPSACMGSANPREIVMVEFDVNAEGATENSRVVDSTNACLEKEAMRAVRGWRYQARTVAGEPVARPGVQTAITFELSGDGVGLQRDSVRPEVLLALRRVSNKMEKIESEAGALELLSELDEIEAEYGEDFNRMETALFHQLRGGVRIGLKDYRGALDDLRISVTLGGAPKNREALSATIRQLEAFVAAEDARAAASPSETAPATAPEAPSAETDGSP